MIRPTLLLAAIVVPSLLSATALAQSEFPPIRVGEGATQVIQVSVPVPATLKSIAVLMQGISGLDFVNAGGGSCKVGASYTAKATCTVSVTFRPKYPGARTGAVVLSDLNGPIATTPLIGTGIAPQLGLLPGIQSYLNIGFGSAAGIALDGEGNVYVADPSAASGLLNTGGVFMATASSDFNYQVAIGSGFAWPVGVAVDGAGNVYVADAGDNSTPSAVYKETLANGEYVQTRIAHGFVSAAGIAVDSNGNVYVADSGDMKVQGAVYKETLSNGEYTQTKIGNGFKSPVSIAVDSGGSVYIADYGDSRVVKLALSGDRYLQSKIGSGWLTLVGIAVDGVGSLYVADDGYNDNTHVGVYKEVESNGVYITQEVIQFVDKSSPASIACEVGPMAIAGNGNLFSTACGGEEMDFSKAPTFSYLFTTSEGATSLDSPRIVSPVNLGNAPLTISSIGYPPNFPGDSQAAVECRAGLLLQPAQSCNVSIDFTPEDKIPIITGKPPEFLNLTGIVSVSSDSLNVPGSIVNAAKVEGQESRAFDLLNLVGSPNPAVVGDPVTFAFSQDFSEGAVTGSVKFSADGKVLGTSEVKNGVASVTTSSLNGGSHSITATFLGNSLLPKLSSTISEHIIAASPIGELGNFDFGKVNIGHVSKAQSVTVSFRSAATLGSIAVVTQGEPDRDFKNTHMGTCVTGKSYSAGAACTVGVTFAPRFAGNDYGGIVLSDPAGRVVGNVYLTGFGNGPQAVFQSETRTSLA